MLARLALVLSGLLVPSVAAVQHPRLAQENVVARLVVPLAKPISIRTTAARWGCRGADCTASDARSDNTSLELCRQLRRHVGPIAFFRRGAASLDPSELRDCNQHQLDRQPGEVVFGDARGGRRLPPSDEARRAHRRAELQITDVKRVDGAAIRVGGVVPVEVFVRNVGDAGATVGLQVADLSRGAARLGYTGATAVNPGKTVSWRVDLVATGSQPSGEALCGERSERLISLVAPPAEPVPGYRPGTREGAAWMPFRDSVIADNRRTVSFRFECDVIFEMPSPSIEVPSLR